MPRASQSIQRREELLPRIAQAFARVGYRRVTTAELARACRVQETILYRLWPDKRAMFIAAIEHVYENSVRVWADVLGGCGGGSVAQRLLRYEAEHLGEFGLYRLLFMSLAESDDAEIRAAVRRTYQRFQRFLATTVAVELPAALDAGHRAAEADRLAWAFIGLGTAANIARELEALSSAERTSLLTEIGMRLLGASSGPTAHSASDGIQNGPGARRKASARAGRKHP